MMWELKWNFEWRYRCQFSVAEACYRCNRDRFPREAVTDEPIQCIQGNLINVNRIRCAAQATERQVFLLFFSFIDASLDQPHLTKLYFYLLHISKHKNLIYKFILILKLLLDQQSIKLCRKINDDDPKMSLNVFPYSKYIFKKLTLTI